MSSIYFIRCKATGLVKIGLSGNPLARLTKMQSDSPGELEMLGTEPGGIEREQELHARFAAHRVRGEWFAPVDELISYVEPLAAPSRASSLKTAADSPTLLAKAVGIGVPHASNVLSGKTNPSVPLALKVYALTGRKLGGIAKLSDDDVEALARIYAQAA